MDYRFGGTGHRFLPSELPQQTKGLVDKAFLGDAKAAEEDIERIHQGEQIYREFQTYTKQRELRWLSVFRRPVWDESQQGDWLLWGGAGYYRA